MKRVDHAWESIGLLSNTNSPPPLATVGVYSTHQPMTNNIQMRGKTVTLRTAEFELVVEVLDNGEDSQDLYDQNKYPDHLGKAAIDTLKQISQPTALTIFAGKVLMCTPRQQIAEPAQVSVGDTLAFFDNQRF